MIAEKINQLKEIQLQQQLVAKKKEEAEKPLLHDLDQIPVLYDWFCDILNSSDFPPNIKSVSQRKKFLIIIIFLYSPASLTGNWILWGLRKKLVETLRITSRSTISDNCADVIFLYCNSPSYREEIDAIYKLLFRRIEAEGWLVENDRKDLD